MAHGAGRRRTPACRLSRSEAAAASQGRVGQPTATDCAEPHARRPYLALSYPNLLHTLSHPRTARAGVQRHRGQPPGADGGAAQGGRVARGRGERRAAAGRARAAAQGRPRRRLRDHRRLRAHRACAAAPPPRHRACACRPLRCPAVCTLRTSPITFDCPIFPPCSAQASAQLSLKSGVLMDRLVLWPSQPPACRDVRQLTEPPRGAQGRSRCGRRARCTRRSRRPAGASTTCACPRSPARSPHGGMTGMRQGAVASACSRPRAHPGAGGQRLWAQPAWRPSEQLGALRSCLKPC
jgi:hypothetical protein